jgi:hypothetical protein
MINIYLSMPIFCKTLREVCKTGYICIHRKKTLWSTIREIAPVYLITPDVIGLIAIIEKAQRCTTVNH